MSAAPAPVGSIATGHYHCSVKGVGRANGRSIVAAAAYRSGERLEDEITGTVADYRARSGVLETFILAPEDAPAWAHDRGKLWNEAEHAEKASNGRLATELELALPHELNAAQRTQLLHDYLRPLVERYGVAADVAIHAPGKAHDHRNAHAHVLITHRTIGPDGFGEVANQRMQMRTRKKEQKLEKISGIAATPADIRAIRKGWEDEVNRAYERAGLDIRVDHRSHKDRGIAQEPTVHLGPEATALERRGQGSELGQVNREITQRNAAREEVAKLEAEVEKITAQIYDLQTERERRYGSLEETYRQVQREQFEARYDVLRAAEPPVEVVRQFDAGAARSTEPVAPIFDRDAADAEWQAKVEAAGIANDNGQKHETHFDRDAADAQWHAKLEAAALAHDAAVRKANSAKRAERGSSPAVPLSEAAAELRAAWTLSRSQEGLEDALAARSWTLARASKEEAENSHRRAAFAKEVGNFALELQEGEIVAVNQYGRVYRFTEHTTGATQAEIEKRLGGIDNATLLSITAASEVMREVSETIWRDEQRQWRDMNTPATTLEAQIAQALATTMTGVEFAQALDAAGVTIARVNARDLIALEALRKEAEIAATVARTEDSANADKNARHFGQVVEGDYAAVTRKGDVIRLNPTALDFEEAEQRLADTQMRLPSIVEARALNEVNRERAEKEWKQRQADQAARATARFEGRQGEQAFRAVFTPLQRAKQGGIAKAIGAADKGLKTAQSVLPGAAKVLEGTIGFLGGLFGAAEPKLTRQQMKDIVRAESDPEMLHAHDVAAAANENQAAHNERMHVQKTAQQEKDVRLAQTLGTPATAEANLNRDEYERQREQERERGGRSL